MKLEAKLLAEEATKIADKANTKEKKKDLLKRELATIESTIRTEAIEGGYMIEWYEEIHSDVKEALEKAGYEVDYPNSSGVYFISWGNGE